MELGFVVVLAIAIYVVAATFDLHEAFDAWAHDYEHLELDEILFPAIGLAVGVLCLSWRHLFTYSKAHRLVSSQNALLLEQKVELERLAASLQTARDEAFAASQAKSHFLATMSHELRTPLNAIIGFADIISQETLGSAGNPKYRDYATDIHESGLHLLDLINDILDLSKIESGRDELHESAVEVGALIGSAITLVKERARQRGVDLATEVENDLPDLCADERKLKQALTNLLSNAIKFSEAGGTVMLRAWCRPASGCVFQIRDTGIGMAPEDIHKALALFGQIDSGLDRRFQGTGLGLPLTKGLVEQHGGTLDLQSQPGAGTTVTVRLPASRILPGRASAEARPKRDLPAA